MQGLFPLSSNLIRDGNTYKQLYELNAMSSGLSLVLLVNLLTAVFGLILYRVFIMERSKLTDAEISLLRRYEEPNDYTPFGQNVYEPPPLRWKSWHEFFTGDDTVLSRDAQTYLLFQRLSAVFILVMGILASGILIPVYWEAGTKQRPRQPPMRGSVAAVTMQVTASEKAELEWDWDQANMKWIPRPIAMELANADEAPGIGISAGPIQHQAITDEKQDRRNHAPKLIYLQFAVRVGKHGKGADDQKKAVVTAKHNNEVDEQKKGVDVAKKQKGTHGANADDNDKGVVDADEDYKGVDTAKHKKKVSDARSLSSRDFFEILSSESISKASTLQYLEVIIICLLSLFVSVLYWIMQSASGGDWENWVLSAEGQWTVFVQGLPKSVNTSQKLNDLFDAIYPQQIVSIEFLYKNGISKAKIEKKLAIFQRKIDYLTSTDENHSNIAMSHPEDPIHVDDHQDNDVVTKVSDFVLNQHIGTATSDTKKIDKSQITKLLDKRQILEKQLQEFDSSRLESLYSAFVSFSSCNTAQDCILTFPASQMLDTEGTKSLLLQKVSGLFSRLVPSSNLRQSKSSYSFYSGDPAEALYRLKGIRVDLAPKPSDIIWKNLGLSFYEAFLRQIIIESIVLTGLIVFTSPIAMLAGMKHIAEEASALSALQFNHNGTDVNVTTLLTSATDSPDEVINDFVDSILDMLPRSVIQKSVSRSLILSYAPLLLLTVINAVVPTLLRLVSVFEGYKTYSAQELSIFKKTFFYIILNTVILPGLALNRASDVMEELYRSSREGSDVQKIFPIFDRVLTSDVPFFLVTYLVQLAFTGNTFWLCRFPANLYNFIRRSLAVTPLELAEAKCTGVFDFPRHYAYNLMVLAMCILFGVHAPLIWFFGLLYFFCKNFVDSYNIRYVHPRSHTDGRLPRCVADFLLVSTLLSQVAMAIVFYTRGITLAALWTCIMSVCTLALSLSGTHVFGGILLSLVKRIFLAGKFDETSSELDLARLHSGLPIIFPRDQETRAISEITPLLSTSHGGIIYMNS